MGIRQVFYESWQMECCGTPFQVGDEVSWPLLLRDADDVCGGGWPDRLTGIAGRTAGRPGLHTAEFHGDPKLPETRGRVHAIQVVTQGYAEMAPGALTRVPIPGERSLRSVRECPKWFADADAGVLVTLEVPGPDSDSP
ncbi:DUF6578 domain-containing protein [Streptomyces sp. NPDC059010]|uniref:DUF6578 domain-containing protein n=1 Tax=Streptomyces sp. NPDC059010 TaxID=3346695 RepID=UPI0036BD417E